MASESLSRQCWKQLQPIKQNWQPWRSRVPYGVVGVRDVFCFSRMLSFWEAHPPSSGQVFQACDSNPGLISRFEAVGYTIVRLSPVVFWNSSHLSIKAKLWKDVAEKCHDSRVWRWPLRPFSMILQEKDGPCPCWRQTSKREEWLC